LTMNFPDVAYKLRKVAHMDGLPLTAKWVKKQIKSGEGR